MNIFACGHLARNAPATALVDVTTQLCRTCSLYSISSAANDLHEKMWAVYDARLMADAAMLTELSGSNPTNTAAPGDGTINPSQLSLPDRPNEMDLAADETVRRLSLSRTMATNCTSDMLKRYEDDEAAARNNLIATVSTWRARWGTFQETDLRVIDFLKARINPNMLRIPPRDTAPTTTEAAAGAETQTQTQTDPMEALIQNWLDQEVVPRSETQYLLSILGPF